VKDKITMVVKKTVQQRAWLIAVARGLGCHICFVASMLQVFKTVISLKIITRGTQLPSNLFRVGNSAL